MFAYSLRRLGLAAFLFGGCCVPPKAAPVRSPAAAATGRPATDADVDRFLAPHEAALEATRRPVAKITLSPMPVDDLRVSKVGGRPWWPAGTPFPVDRNGQPLALLAQIDLAEVPPELGDWPHSGLLQFFVASDDTYGLRFDGPASRRLQEGFRVVRWADPSGPSADLPPAVPAFLPLDPQKPRRIRFSAGTERLSHEDRRFAPLFGDSLFEAESAWAEANGVDERSMWEAVYRRTSGAGHKIGGYPAFTQEDPRGGEGFELLLQLDTDDEMMWGDSGVGNFFIHPDALRRGDFSDVLYTWDCA